MSILTGEIKDFTKEQKKHYNKGDIVVAKTINDIQDTAIDAHNMATEALDKADSVFQGNGTVVSVGGVQVGTLAFSSDPQQQLDTLNSKIGTASSFNAEIVDQLPTENISTSTFYLIKNSTSADDNTYSEYLYVNGKWELLGNTQVQAYDDSELRALINNLSVTKANQSDLNTTNANVSANTTAINNKLDKVTNSATTQVYGVDATGQQTMYTTSKTSINNNIIVQRTTDGHILVPLVPSGDNVSTSKSYVDTKGGEIYSHINSEVERVEGLIANAGGTVVTVGSTPVTSLKFDSNPQTQITNLETSLYNTKQILESNVEANASDIDKLETSVSNLETNKADKVSGATADNLASLDENGNLQDSGFAVNNGTNDSFGKIPCISDAGVLEAGKYIDFHETSNDADYSVRLQSNGSNANTVKLPTSSGTLVLDEDFIRPSSSILVYNTSTGEAGTYNFTQDISAYNMLVFAIYNTNDNGYTYVNIPRITFQNNSGNYPLKVDASDATTTRTMFLKYVNTTSFTISSIPNANMRLRRIYAYKI